MRWAPAALVAGLVTLPVLSPPAFAIPWCSDVSANGGVAACGDITARDIIVGLKPVEVQELMHELFAQESAAVRKIEEPSRQLGVTEAATKRFFEILGEQQVPVEQLPERLGEIAGRYKGLLARVQTAVSDDPKIEELRTQAQAAIESGDLSRAEDLLDRTKTFSVENASQQLTQAEKGMLDAAEIAFSIGKLRMARLRYSEAATSFEEAVRLIPPDYRTKLIDFLSELPLHDHQAGVMTMARKVLGLVRTACSIRRAKP